MLIEPGDVVLVEEPSYLAALQAFALAGARVVPVACDDDGLDPDAVAAAAAEHGARLLYTIPTFHNPTGRTLPLERRRALAAVAERHGLWLIEDDPYGELRYRGEPLPSLATLRRRGPHARASRRCRRSPRPGCAIGWVRTPRGPAPVARGGQAGRRPALVDDRPGGRRALARRRRPRRAHRRPARRVRRAAATRCSTGWPTRCRRARRTTVPRAACSCGRGCPDGWDAEELLRRALERDVAFVPGYPFFAGEPDRATLRFSFTTHSPEEIAEGLARLRGSWHWD